MTTTRITGLYAWVFDDPSGERGILGVMSPAGFSMHAVSSSRDVIEKMRPIAAEAAAMAGMPIQLRHFAVMTVLEEIKP